MTKPPVASARAKATLPPNAERSAMPRSGARSGATTNHGGVTSMSPRWFKPSKSSVASECKVDAKAARTRRR